MTDTIETDVAAPSQIFTVNEDGELQLHPHRFQWQAMHSQAQNLFLLKGWRAGFSSWAPFWLLDEMRRCGPGNSALNYFAAVPTLASARSALIPELVRIFTEYYKVATYNKNENVLFMTEEGDRRLWGHKQRERTPVKFVYADDPTSFGSMTSIGGIADEIGQPKFKLESYRTLLSRMATQRGRVAPGNAQFASRGFPSDMKCGRMLAGSTVWNLGWLQDMWDDYMRGVQEAAREYVKHLKLAATTAERAAIKQDFYRRWYIGVLHRRLHFIRFDSTANPTVSKEEFEEARRSLPDWFFDMRYRALFRRPAGVIYDCWNPAQHVWEPTEKFNPDSLPSHWPRSAGIDFGRRNFHALIFAHDTERDRHIIYKSYHDAHLSNAERAAELLKLEPKLENVVAGQIAEQDDRDELAAGGLPARPPLFKGLDSGITTVYSAIRNNKLFIFKGVCPEFESEMRQYARPVDDRGNVDADADPADKETYHWCFVAGTPILTPTGQKPIETVNYGDEVMTRQGARRVMGMGSRKVNVKRVDFSDGRSLVGTPDHPIWVNGKGFTAIDALRYGDIIYSCPKEMNQSSGNVLSSPGGDISATQIPNAVPTECISSTVHDFTTATYTNPKLARYLPVIISTTKTIIRSIMPLRIWKQCRKDSILATTAKEFVHLQSALIWTSNDLRRRHGTDPMPDVNGTGSIAFRYSKTGNLWSTLVCSVERAFFPRRQVGFCTVVGTVKPSGGAIIYGKIVGAFNAIKSFLHQQINPASFAPSHAPVNRASINEVFVTSVQNYGVATVYNIGVEDVPEYFANGILVHNCDSLRYYGTHNFSAVGSAPLLARAGGRPSQPDKLYSGGESAGIAAHVAPDRETAAPFAGSANGAYRRALAERYGNMGLLEPHLDIDF